MERWEYMVVDLNTRKVVKVVVDGAPYQIPNKPLFGGAELSKFLTIVGEQGWDLISATDWHLILKRAKQ